MVIAFAVLLAALAVLAVAYPIVLGAGSHDRSTETASQQELSELLAQREAAFQALRDLRFDREVGKLSTEDFQAFEANLKLNAADVLRRLDNWEAAADREIRSTLDSPPGPAAGQDGTVTEVEIRRCPHCESEVAPDDVFCTYCGREVSRAAAAAVTESDRFCRKCGRKTEQGNLYCTGCGSRL
jgi:hypothetical protein